MDRTESLAIDGRTAPADIFFFLSFFNFLLFLFFLICTSTYIVMISNASEMMKQKKEKCGEGGHTINPVLQIQSCRDR